MGLFHKNLNGVNSAGGSRNIMEAIQNQGGNDLLVWRDPRENFNTKTVVTVNPGEEAIFIKNGEYMGTLGEGRHELSTENYTLLSSIRNMLTGGVSTFTCRIYFVRMAESEVNWGTASPIEFNDYDLELPTKVRGAGTYRVTFNDSFKFLKKVVGNDFTFSANDLSIYFQSQLSQEIFTLIADRLEDVSKEEPVLAVTKRLKEFAKVLTPSIQEILDDYGIELTNYSIEHLTIDEDEDRREMIHRKSAAKSKMLELERMGGAYQTVKGMELLQTIAENPGGGIANMGAGLGLGMAAGNAFGNVAQSVFAQQAQMPQQPPQPAPTPDPVETLKKMKQMLEAGLITQQIYDGKVAEIMSRL